MTHPPGRAARVRAAGQAHPTGRRSSACPRPSPASPGAAQRAEPTNSQRIAPAASRRECERCANQTQGSATTGQIAAAKASSPPRRSTSSPLLEPGAIQVADVPLVGRVEGGEFGDEQRRGHGVVGDEHLGELAKPRQPDPRRPVADPRQNKASRPPPCNQLPTCDYIQSACRRPARPARGGPAPRPSSSADRTLSS